ncbi:hypothetical protein PT974_03583 [Cladobotryum mycophilum]|uniref:Uncharacterized protein n=1 Tax=Cladobotryum mycophilum TaxID=491253 RepID=A0ABR0SSP5_9HYPO
MSTGALEASPGFLNWACRIYLPVVETIRRDGLTGAETLSLMASLGEPPMAINCSTKRPEIRGYVCKQAGPITSTLAVALFTHASGETNFIEPTFEEGETNH